jgi:hypothetical protein
VWTVNTVADMRRYIAGGVDNIITDEPATAVAMVEEMRELTLAERVLITFHYRIAP